MKAEFVFQALIELWEQLPRMFGNDWERVSSDLQSTIFQLNEVGYNENDLADRMCQIFEGCKSANTALRKKLGVFKELLSIHGNGKKNSFILSKQTQNSSLQLLASSMGGYKAFWGVDLRCPEIVTLQETLLIRVGLTKEAPYRKKLGEDLLIGKIYRPVEVLLEYSQDDFVSEDEQNKELNFLNTPDDLYTYFALQPKKIGKKKLNLVFRQNGKILSKSNPFSIVINKHQEPVKRTRPKKQPVTFSSPVVGSSVADLILMVKLKEHESSTVFEYSLFSFNGTVPISKVDHEIRLTGTDRQLDVLKHKMIRFAREGSLPLKINGIGRQLYDLLIPWSLKREFRSFGTKVRTFSVCTNETVVPWELIRPYDHDGILSEENFWGMKYKMTRQLREGKQNGSLQVNRFLCTDNNSDRHSFGGKNLTFEQRILRKLKRQYNVDVIEDVTPEKPGLCPFLKIMESQEVDLCYFGVQLPLPDEIFQNETIPIFEDRERLEFDDFYNLGFANMRRTHPLFFFNYKREENRDFLLIRLDHLIKTLVEKGHSGCLIFPIWPVERRIANRFALCFFRRLMKGDTVGQALLNSRKYLKKKFPGSIDYLAFSAFSNPCSKVIFGEKRVISTIDQDFHTGKRIARILERYNLCRNGDQLMTIPGFPKMERKTFYRRKVDGFSTDEVTEMIKSLGLGNAGVHLFYDTVDLPEFDQRCDSLDLQKTILKKIVDG